VNDELEGSGCGLFQETVPTFARSEMIKDPSCNMLCTAETGNQHFLNLKSDTCPLPQIFGKRKMKLKKEEINQILTQKLLSFLNVAPLMFQCRDPQL
jgi:hypothetical protein